VEDTESKYKTELNRLRKKYEQALGDYETQLDTLTRSNGELARANKALAARIKVCHSASFCDLLTTPCSEKRSLLFILFSSYQASF